MIRYHFPDLRITLTERQFEEISSLCERLPYISGLEFERRARRIARLTRAQAYAICRAIREKRYVKIIKWYKVLAVLTLVGTTEVVQTERHLEARMLIDCPFYEYGKEEFEHFCMWCLERFYELNGYAVEMIEASIELGLAFFGMERVDEFEDRENREVDVWLEIYDYNYSNVPFECQIKLSPYYWLNYENAKKEFLSKVEARRGGRVGRLDEFVEELFEDTVEKAKRGVGAEEVKWILEEIEKEKERRKEEVKKRRKAIEEERKEEYRRGEHLRR